MGYLGGRGGGDFRGMLMGHGSVGIATGLTCGILKALLRGLKKRLDCG